MMRKAMYAVSVLAAGAALTLPAAPAIGRPAARADACSITPYGLIGDRWWTMGGANSPLGCATEAEHDVPGRRGRAQQFTHGAIVWSPDQGGQLTVAAYQEGQQIQVVWGPTDPFHYNKFIVRWDRFGSNVDQKDTPKAASLKSGNYSIGNLPGPGGYSVIVEGCDVTWVGGSNCRQGWTVPAIVNVQ